MERLVRQGLDARRYVHVEAGIKLYELNEALWERGKAMPTLGGSQGQSLAGAISTGTHGGDFDRPPIADAVRAILLVGRGGRQYWLEPSTSPLSSGNALQIPGGSRDVGIVRDDAIFHAVQLSMGRCGVIYSFVIEVDEAYDLEEWRYNATWHPVRMRGFEVIRQTLLEATSDWRTAGRLRRQRSPLGSPNDVRYLQVDINPAPEDIPITLGVPPWEFHRACVTKRWATRPSARFESPASNPTHYHTDAHFVGAFRTNQGALTEPLFRSTVRTAWLSKRFDRLSRDRSYYVMAGRADPYPDFKSHMAAMWEHQWRFDSIEFFFDAENPLYLSFVDQLLEMYYTMPGRKPGYISLRFMKRSKATLAMQRWEVTVSVECAYLRGFPGTERGIQEALALGERFNAVFHWGQLQPPDYGDRIPELFGPALRDWRMAIRLVGVVPGDTFSNEYSRSHQLEPLVRAGRPSSYFLLFRR
jgi:hypothetical protein